MIDIRRYSAADASRWNEFVEKSRNGTFLHLRGYMDYHADRFADFSLVAIDNRGKWVAVLPACRQGNTVSSHAGLTFAGWIMSYKANALTMLQVMDAALRYLAAEGVDTLLYKAIPYIYTAYPAQEDLYAICRCGAQIHGSMLASAVELTSPMPYDMAYRQDVRRAAAAGISVVEAYEDAHWLQFWQLLTDHLRNRFGSTPVHSFAEISLLRSRFPKNIRLYLALLGEQLMGGTVVYHSRTAAHSQYTVLSEQGRNCRVLPALNAFAMEAARGLGETYFDFGTSAADTPTGLNEGLISQKIASGARGVLYTTYRISIP